MTQIELINADKIGLKKRLKGERLGCVYMSCVEVGVQALPVNASKACTPVAMSCS